jgi:hypothetical protein
VHNEAPATTLQVHSPTSSDRSKKENANGNNIGLQELIQMNEGIKSRYE